ncbi:conjugal transfer protein TraG [Stappia aggregata IAM 12614]|uniref:Conjugal transfer protein TraG n=1 Tax=Roseibium aggregatum (strain ATCC 25650 / DSM 13394 / JCM 20685 / NBRC 16684 / NCIMB 2208 / IAM 12614 / B1) TaxID=384765 RepID=A0P4D9_ROSAI|nr:type IV secretory system conjugative DNA transfer family protein [Roseibium aggregatum]EAV40101.1 conjugal transfer protein TraG [Stappia aggregata IAM 12614] [Roseibium aggregatum IAM 12614]
MDAFALIAVIVVVSFAAALFYQLNNGVGGAIARARTPLPQPAAAKLPPAPKSLEDIEAFHANELNAITLTIAELTPHLLPETSFYHLSRAVSEKHAYLSRDAADDDYLLKAAGSVQRDYIRVAAERALKGASFRRTLRDMTDTERATLRLADLLTAVGQISRRERLEIFTPIIWNSGQGFLITGGPFNSADLLSELRSSMTTLIEGHLGPSPSATERLQDALRKALGPDSHLTVRERTVLERLLVTGAKWMPPESAATALVYGQPLRPSVLRLGRIEGSDSELLYDRNESLITIAPPGQGKSQSVMRNLLSMDGGALVIDIKGELFEQTAAWRARNVGPVYRFAPSDPDNSIHFNPLDTIRPDVAGAYEDARKLVNLLMVPAEQGKKDYWDKRGLSLLADAILDTALFEEPDTAI